MFNPFRGPLIKKPRLIFWGITKLEELDSFLIHLIIQNHFMPLVSFYTPENIRKPKVLWCFQEYRKRPVAWNGLTWSSPGSQKVILIWQKLIPKAFHKSFLGTFCIYIFCNVGVGHKEMNSTHIANPMKHFFSDCSSKVAEWS